MNEEKHSVLHRIFFGSGAGVGARTFELSPDVGIDVANGKQPMYSADGRHAIVFNGEIYNYLTVRTELQKLGHAFETNCDTEVVLRAFDAWGMEGFKRLEGMFASSDRD